MLNEIDSSSWSFSGYAYYYLFPDRNNLATLLAYADYKNFHSEIRYNYEGENTASVFAGYRMSGGKKINWGITPIVGYLFGDLNGILPGVKIDLTWKKFDFYSESEYMHVTGVKEENYFYTYSELAYNPMTQLRIGGAANRTKLFHSSLDFQRGIFAQYIIKQLTAGIYFYNPFSSERYTVASLFLKI